MSSYIVLSSFTKFAVLRYTLVVLLILSEVSFLIYYFVMKLEFAAKRL